MHKPIFISGEAGAGKTRRLMERAAVIGSRVMARNYQSALAMAVMHGARKRLQYSLANYCPEIPSSLCTAHSFALALVNRWRRSLGLMLPVVASEKASTLEKMHLRVHLTFDEVMRLACKLLESSIVRRTISEAYPLVIVDEFQDCIDDTLHFVQGLAEASILMVAADDFQMLNDKVTGCPAVQWSESLQRTDAVILENLKGCRRTEDIGILRAARALRDNTKATSVTVPVYYAPNVGPAAYRMVARFVPWAADRIVNGTCALIAPSLGDTLVRKLLASFQNQLARKNPSRKVIWSQPLGEEEQLQQILLELGIDSTENDNSVWIPHQVESKQAAAVLSQITRFSRLRGIHPIPQGLAIEFAALAIHNARAYGANFSRFQVLTVHGAKNREFDHVFVFWGYKAAGWNSEQQRRLLYNAVTRARRDCTVLVLGKKEQIYNDPVLSLLGPPMPAIDPNWKKSPKTNPN